jgi:endonuclease YncB( thermonuclease family)
MCATANVLVVHATNPNHGPDQIRRSRARLCILGAGARAHAEFPVCGSGKLATCVADGDTMWFEGVKYRSEEIDTPEKGALAECMQEGLQAIEATTRLVESCLRTSARSSGAAKTAMAACWRGLCQSTSIRSGGHRRVPPRLFQRARSECLARSSVAMVPRLQLRARHSLDDRDVIRGAYRSPPPVSRQHHALYLDCNSR